MVAGGVEKALKSTVGTATGEKDSGASPSKRREEVAAEELSVVATEVAVEEAVAELEAAMVLEATSGGRGGGGVVGKRGEVGPAA